MTRGSTSASDSYPAQALCSGASNQRVPLHQPGLEICLGNDRGIDRSETAHTANLVIILWIQPLERRKHRLVQDPSNDDTVLLRLKEDNVTTVLEALHSR